VYTLISHGAKGLIDKGRRADVDWNISSSGDSLFFLFPGSILYTINKKQSVTF